MKIETYSKVFLWGLILPGALFIVSIGIHGASSIPSETRIGIVAALGLLVGYIIIFGLPIFIHTMVHKKAVGPSLLMHWFNIIFMGTGMMMLLVILGIILDHYQIINI